MTALPKKDLGIIAREAGNLTGSPMLLGLADVADGTSTLKQYAQNDLIDIAVEKLSNPEQYLRNLHDKHCEQDASFHPYVRNQEHIDKLNEVADTLSQWMRAHGIQRKSPGRGVA